MAGLARDIIGYKYYKPLLGMRDKAEEILKEEKSRNPNKIHYVISASKNYPGRFLLSYLPRARVTHEYVSVTPDGYKYRQRTFDSLTGLLRWFKEHFREPPPVATPAGRTPARTPHTSAYHTPAGHTPAFHTPAHTPGPAYINTPYTPSAQTPYMTPFAATPRQPEFMPPPSRARPQPAAYSEPADWQKAAEDWMRRNNREASSTPRAPTTPRAPRTPRDHHSHVRDARTPHAHTPHAHTPHAHTPHAHTPHAHTPHSSGRSSRAHSLRSTPHTNTSPRSMSLGDATPLYDEN